MFQYALLLASALLSATSTVAITADPKIILRSKSEADALWRKGYLLGDEQIDRQLQDILDSLTVGRSIDPAIQLRAHVFRSPEINAFAIPNGSIYIFVGLLANLTSREQMAFILAHEAQHAIDLHGQRNLEQAKSKATALGVLSLGSSIALGASGIAGAGLIDAFAQLGLSLVGAASINGYGRDLEKNADLVGLEMTSKAGISGCASVESMRVLLDNDKDSNRVANFFWGNHPLLRSRIEYLQASVGGSCPDSMRVDATYESIRWSMTRKAVELWLTAEEPREGIRPALRYLRRFPNDPGIHCDLGDLYAQIALQIRKKAAATATSGGAFKPSTKGAPSQAAVDTLALAVAEYETALALGGEAYRPPLRGMALAAEAQGDTLTCISYLEKYLEGEAQVPNRRAMARKLRDLRQRQAAGTSTTVDSLATRSDH